MMLDKRYTINSIFETVVEHLIAQKFQRAMRPTTSNQSNYCAYRGENGSKCAIGCLIPDEEYTPEIEGKLITELYRTKSKYLPLPTLRNIFDSVPIDFLAHMQLLHDHMDHESDFMNQFDHIACHEDYGIDQDLVKRLRLKIKENYI